LDCPKSPAANLQQNIALRLRRRPDALADHLPFR
jgi:hypothetical protein